MALSKEAVAYLLHHVILPFQLPQKDDYDADHERSLIEASIEALQDLEEYVRPEHIEIVSCAITTLHNTLRGRDSDGHVSESQLQELLDELACGSNNGMIALEIRAQNAGVLISRAGGDIVFEFFELAPTNEAVMTCKGRLKREFPAFASKIAVSSMLQIGLTKSLACTLAMMSSQLANGFQQQTKKACNYHDENRDTNHPGMVTDYLLNIIAALGSPTSTTRLTKHTREEVLWKQADKPWRRSPLWLLLRVTLQLVFTRDSESMEYPNDLYKSFMVLLLSRILNLTHENWNELGDESLHAIIAKMERRMRKIDALSKKESLQNTWSHPVRKQMKEIQRFMCSNWNKTVSNVDANIDLSVLHKLRPQDSLNMGLPNLNSFLSSIESRQSQTVTTTFKPCNEFSHFPATQLPNILEVKGEFQYYHLAAIETWVKDNLFFWLTAHLQDSGTCGHISSLMQSYHSSAKAAYNGIPMSLSTMYLTLVELWVACDQAACSQYPLLTNYDSEVQLDVLQCLSLPLRAQMSRLHTAETYIQSRATAASKENPSIYRKFGDPLSFAVRFFDADQSMQDIKAEIERKAAIKRAAKCKELEEIRQEYTDLISTYNESGCECVTEIRTRRFRGRWEDYTHTIERCGRCEAKREADGLQITVYEWPLSANLHRAKATVFELKLPEAFGDWRDASMYLISDVLRFKNEKRRRLVARYMLPQHQELWPMLSPKNRHRRITPLSEAKPHFGTHYKSKDLPNLNSKKICVKNGLRYRYYDTIQEIWSGDLTTTDELPRSCNYSMPKQSKYFERYSYKPPSAVDGVPSNEAIASLSECPVHFLSDEYKACGTLPLGRNLIYPNILAQLAMPNLDFAKIETQIMIMQAIHQAGPVQDGEVERTVHRTITDDAFSKAMLRQLTTALQGVAKNWDSWRALSTFIQLALRILSLTTSADIEEWALEYLAEARGICMEWLNRLHQRAVTSTNGAQRTELYTRVTEVALVCVSTYDVEYDLFEDIIDEPDVLSILLQCSIKIRESYGSTQPDNNAYHIIMLQSWRVLMVRSLSTIQSHLIVDGAALNDAVYANWTAFQPHTGTQWKEYNKLHEQWLEIHSGTLPVHFNLLTGELIIGGLPLTRLPWDFTAHGMYQPLFQNCVLDVANTEEPGMKFSAKSTHYGFKLHFAISGDDMLMVAIGNGFSKLDLLPSRILLHQLPNAFVKNYIHWFDHDSKEVNFRPRSQPWPREDVKDEWRLVRSGASWRLVKDTIALVNLASECSRTLARIFYPLEDPTHIHLQLNSVSQTLMIEFPRLQLDFHFTIGDPHIHSRQYRGMEMDHDQCTGTFVGLESKLVLRNNATGERLLLVPEGRIAYAKSSQNRHVSVSVAKDSATRIHAYGIDPILGRIVDLGDLQGKLFASYLHALTSSHLPDPLTGYTGTESALNILRSASIRSFEILSSENINLLALLAKLSPSRVYYPHFEQVMQQIGWDQQLPALAQHPAFLDSVLDIFKEARKMKLFYSSNDFQDPKGLPSINACLQVRAIIRSSTFRVSSYGAEKFSTSQDKIYESRDKIADSARGQRAYSVARVIVRDQVALFERVCDLKASFTSRFRNVRVEGVSREFKISDLRYDTKWLGDVTSLLCPLWCSIHNELSKSSTTKRKYDIVMWLSTMAFSNSVDMDILQALAAMYKVQDVQSVEVPAMRSVMLNLGDSFDEATISQFVVTHYKSIDLCPEGKTPWNGTGTISMHQTRMNASFERNQKDAKKALQSSLMKQYPTREPTMLRNTETSTYIHLDNAKRQITTSFCSWVDNSRFNKYLQDISEILARQSTCAPIKPIFPHCMAPAGPELAATARFVSPRSIFAASAPGESLYTQDDDDAIMTNPLEPQIAVIEGPPQTGQSSLDIEYLCRDLNWMARSDCDFEYAAALEASCNALSTYDDQSKIRVAQIQPDTEKLLRDYQEACQAHFEELGLALARAVESQEGSSNYLALIVGQIPRISPTFWLSCLNRDSFSTLSEPWKDAIIEYALAITRLHRAHRLVVVSNKPHELAEQLDHVGHTNWDPWEYPESLLLEAESGILIRERQETIAREMRAPPNQSNTVMQLNMGEGKSSTIVPMVAAYLADKTKLVRVVVAKAQSKQMLQMLIAKLGGLLNRRVYHMPFSRSICLGPSEATALIDIYRECMTTQGVLLVQPEHVLSFKLMAIESLMADDRQDTAKYLLEGQVFFDQYSRDVIDEADSNFDCKFELIYTMGSQRCIEFAPERWLIIQNVLGLVPRYARQVMRHLPLSIEMQSVTDNRFPRIRVLRKDAGDKLLALIAKHIVDYGINHLPIRGQPPHTRAAVEAYLTKQDLNAEEICNVESGTFWLDSTKNAILLLRGLLAGGILRFILMSKRWRVNFGLDTDRIPPTKLAVPYRFKDGPAVRSEFSHPDILLPLTQLSYYYGGLTDQEMFDAFNHLVNSDQATIQYNEWVQTASPQLPSTFKQLSGVSIKDRLLCIEHVFPHLRYSKALIDYYLSYLIFPKSVKEHEYKLSASGWDLGVTKTHPSTGFSGTNDTKHLLPLPVKHLDLDSQRHTNALVLRSLLQDKTPPKILLPRTDGTDTEHLLAAVTRFSPEVRVVLDCGAIIIEQNNRQFAETWLTLSDPDSVQAAVYFEDEDLMVLDRKGRSESFVTSPFAKQLDVCVIYLDEAHTRGTDLRLPRNYRAALTLGAGLCKDKLVQAAMRMRQLGRGQSVVFVVPQEIETKIRERNRQRFPKPIKVEDILCWSIGETWNDLKKSMPLWSVQGVRHENQKQFWNGVDTTKEQAKSLLEPEAQTLQARYQPLVQDIDGSAKVKGWDTSNENIAEIVKRCRDFNAMGFTSADLDEEQERELAPEKEEERQVQRLPKMDAAEHSIHDDVLELATTGKLRPKTKAFIPAFQALKNTSAAKRYPLTDFPRGLLVTEDFMRTIKPPAGSHEDTYVADSYLRPVQWIISVPTDPDLEKIHRLVIISPHEANKLMDVIRYAPLDHLQLYTIGRSFNPASVPRSLTVQLNLFSGSLYISTYAEYTELCTLLGLLQTTAAPDQRVLADGFLDPPAGTWKLQTSPVSFLRALLMRIRREGEGLEMTHLGKILNGVRLEEADFRTDTDMQDV